MTMSHREVDHEQRRQKIAEITIEVIGQEGLEAATVRRIAARAGYSTTVITHYFKNKDELLLLAYQHIGKLARQRVEQVCAQDPGNILGALMTMTTADDTVHHAWRVYTAIWQKSAENPAFATARQSWIDTALSQITAMIQHRTDNHPDSPRLARHLIALVQGTAVQNLFDPDSWSQTELESTLHREIDYLLASLS